jgi:hypothetical protein
MLPLKKRHVKPLQSCMGSTKAVKEAGQDTKEAYNRTLEKARID